MDIKAEEITMILREQLDDFATSLDVAEVGTIVSVGDGIARVHGLEKVMAGELLKFPHGVYGMAVITALTVQNTTGVTGVHDVPAEFVAAHLP